MDEKRKCAAHASGMKDSCEKWEHQAEPEIGDFAECINGHVGFVIDIKDSPYGRMIFIALADGRVYHFPLDMLRRD